MSFSCNPPRSFRKLPLLVGALAIAGLAEFGLSTAAQAGTLVPQQEGEVSVIGVASVTGTPIATSGYTIESLVDATTGTKSLLFVDKAGTANAYPGIQFLASDIGTTDPTNAYWFRPVAISPQTGQPAEGGQLEVGTFKFTFDNVISDLKLRWLDTELANATSFTVLDVNDVVTDFGYVPAGPDGNIFEKSFANVKSITLKLGAHGQLFPTGDGVNFQVSVPEPGSVLGLLALGAFGAAGSFLKKKQTV